MEPKIWGPHAWVFLHSITLTYPINPTNKQKSDYRTFFLTLQHVLPCYKCRVNYVNHLKKFPITESVLKTRQTLVNWLIDVHNEINIEKGKKKVSHIEALTMVNSSYKQRDFIWYIIILIFLILILIYLFRKFS